MRGASLVVRVAIPGMMLFLVCVQIATVAAQAPKASWSAVTPRDVSEGVYAPAQAARGKALFQKECAACHSDDPQVTQASGRGWWGGERRNLSMLVGEQFLKKYGTAGDLYTKMYRTQPPNNVGGLGPQGYTDILAYLFQASGLAPGTSELAADFSLLRNVSLNEKGFKPLFNGTDFSGMGFVIGLNCKPQPQGCARTEPGTTFRIETGELISTGTPSGYWYPLEKYLNFTLRLDYKWVRPRDAKPDEPFFGNTGYLLFITEHQVWPKTLEIQGREKDVTMDAVLRAGGAGGPTKFVSKDDPEARAKAWKPTGEWNSAEIVSRNGQVWSYLNGALVNTVTEHEFKQAGYIGFQSEGGEVHWRNIRIKAE